MGNFTKKSYHRNCLLWKNGLKWLNLESFNLLESRLLRGRECSSLLVHALSHFCFTHFTSYSLIFFLFIYPLYFFLYFLFFSCFYVSYYFSLFSRFVYCVQLRPFYTTCRDKIYHFTPQLVRTYVFHMLRIYVMILCNWLILWQNALYLYFGRLRICLNTSRNHVSRSSIETFKSVQEIKQRVQIH